jgi:outer membrane protein assembly factor BamB
MPDSESAIVFYCPNCGSSVAIEGERGICAYCGTAIERPRKDKPASTPEWPPTIKPIPRAVRADVPSSRRGPRPAAVLVLLIVVGLAGFLAGRAFPSTTAVAPPDGPGGVLPTAAPPVVQLGAGSVSELATVLPIDGPGGDPIVYLYHSGAGNSSFYTVARVDGATRATRWQSQPLGKNAYQGLLRAGDGMVFLTDEDKLLALRQADGSLAWQATLEVEPQVACEECLRLVRGRLLVLEKNGGLQAFDAQSGQLAWSTRLENTPRELSIVGDDRVLIIRESQDTNGRLLSFLDASTGKPGLQLDPRCPKAHENFDEERPGWDTPFLFSADGRSMYTIFGFFSKCAQGWDMAAGKPGWQVAIDDNLVPGSWSSGRPLLADDAVFVGNGKLLWALATADGSTRTLVEDKEYNLTPVAARDGMLIVVASPTWDSQRKLLWGLDAQTGERHWQLKLDAHEWLGLSSSGDFDLRLTAKGLTVVQVLREDAKLVVETLNPRTGASQTRQESALEDMSMPGLRRSFWGDDTAWLEIDSDIFAVDLATGTIAYRLS